METFHSIPAKHLRNETRLAVDKLHDGLEENDTRPLKIGADVILRTPC